MRIAVHRARAVRRPAPPPRRDATLWQPQKSPSAPLFPPSQASSDAPRAWYAMSYHTIPYMRPSTPAPLCSYHSRTRAPPRARSQPLHTTPDTRDSRTKLNLKHRRRAETEPGAPESSGSYDTYAPQFRRRGAHPACSVQRAAGGVSTAS